VGRSRKTTVIVKGRGGAGPPTWDPALKRLTHVGILEIDDQGRTVHVNLRMAQMLGYSREEMLGKHVFEFVDPAWREVCEVNLKRRRQGIAEQHESCFRRKDGTPMWASLAAIPLIDWNGNFRGVVNEVIDITPQKEREAELEAQKRVHEAMISALEEVFVRRRVGAEVPANLTLLAAPASYEEVMATRLVEVACDVTGAHGSWYFRYDPKNRRLVLLGCVGLLPPRPPEGSGCGSVTLGEGFTGRAAARRQPAYQPDLQGSSHWEARCHPGIRSAYFVPVCQDDTLFGVYAIFSRRADGFTREHRILADALASYMSTAMEKARLFAQTQRAAERMTQIQRQLLEAQKMEALGQLAGGVAHDLNNYLMAIRGLIDLYEPRPGREPEEPVGDAFRRMREAVERAASLTRRLLLLSRKHPQHKTRLDLNHSIEGLLAILRCSLGDAIVVESRFAPDLWPVHADPTNMDQVLTNLIINAKDAMPEGGVLTVSTENVEVPQEYCEMHPGEAAPGRHVRVTVSDTGIGMDEHVRSRIFEPFFTTKGPERGLGLGLSVSYGIVKSHDGWIEVTSEPGRGSTFAVYIPASDECATGNG
jgi:PAS domain S-box-containing protein